MAVGAPAGRETDMESGVDRSEVETLFARVSESDLPIVRSILETISRGAWEAPSFEQVLGFRTDSPKPGTANVEFRVEPHMLNPNGFLHGGVLFSAMDSSMGSILMKSLPEGERCATIEAKINFISALSEGIVRVETRVVHRGGRIAVLESKARDSTGKLAAIMTGTFIILR
jgi:uncharacterized protein (TIGR00369 family)